MTSATKIALARLASQEREFFAGFVPTGQPSEVVIACVKVRLRGKNLYANECAIAHHREPCRPNSHLGRLLQKVRNCTYCGRLLNAYTCSLDHCHPKSKGGKSHERNLVIACLKCNGIKGNMSPEKWQAILPKLIEDKYFFMTKRKRRQWREANPGLLK